MRFNVTVTLGAAHSELVAMPLNTGWFRGEFSIVEGNCIGNCEKDRPYDHVSNFEWLPRQKCSNTEASWKVTKKDEFLDVNGILIFT